MSLSKILIVDDEKIIRDGISRAINWQELGMELIGSCEDGFDALEWFEKNPPRIAIVDIKMPGMSGLELIETVRLKGMPIHFIILSGYSEFEYARKAINFGVKQYLLKPIDPEKLKASLIEIRELIEEESEHNKWTLERIFRNALANRNPREWIAFDDSRESETQQFRVVAVENPDNFTDIGNDNSFWQNYCDLGFICKQKIDNFDVFLLKTDEHTGNDYLYLFLKELITRFSSVGSHAIAVLSSASGRSETIYSQWLECKEKILEFELRKLISLEEAETFSSMAVVVKKLKQNILFKQVDLAKMHCDQIFNIIDESRKSLQKSKEMIFKILDLLMVEKQEKNRAEWLSLQMEILNSSDGTSMKKNFNLAVLELIEKRDLSQSLGKYPWLVEKTRQEIQNNYNDHDLSLRTFCSSVVFTNPDYLGKLFQKHTSLSFHAYLNRVRIDAAKQLIIQNPYIAMYEVANKVGFGDNSHYFSKVFKSLEEVSPSFFRDRVKDGFLL